MVRIVVRVCLLAIVSLALFGCREALELQGLNEPLNNSSSISNEGGIEDPLDGTHWQLVAMTGLDDTLALLSDDQLPTLSFQEGGFRFDTDCNNPGGSYVVRGSQIEVSAVRTTTMLCSPNVDYPAPQVEGALATIASTLESYSISGDELRLGYPDGELVLKRLQD